MESFKTDGATIFIRPDGILHIHYDDVFLKLEDTKRIFAFIRSHCPWEKSPVYLSGGSFTSQDPASRKFNGSHEVTKHCTAIAILSTSMSQKIVANFYMRIVRPAVPTRSFSNETEAIAWLRNFETIDLIK